MVGQTISHYKILEKLGEGGMGEAELWAAPFSLDDLTLEREPFPIGAIGTYPSAYFPNTQFACGRTQTDAKENVVRYRPFDAGSPKAVDTASRPQLAVIRPQGQRMRNVPTRSRLPLHKLLILLNDEVLSTHKRLGAPRTAKRPFR